MLNPIRSREVGITVVHRRESRRLASHGSLLGRRDERPTERSPGPPPAAHAQRRAAADHAAILVVDDDAAIRSMVARTLESAGYTPTTAADGEAALREVARVRPRLIVLDMRMPRMDGRRFAEELRARGYGIPLVIMTALSDARRSARQVEAAAYVAKPFDIDDLILAVEQVLDRER